MARVESIIDHRCQLERPIIAKEVNNNGSSRRRFLEREGHYVTKGAILRIRGVGEIPVTLLTSEGKPSALDVCLIADSRNQTFLPEEEFRLFFARLGDDQGRHKIEPGRIWRVTTGKDNHELVLRRGFDVMNLLTEVPSDLARRSAKAKINEFCHALSQIYRRQITLKILPSR